MSRHLLTYFFSVANPIMVKMYGGGEGGMPGMGGMGGMPGGMPGGGFPGAGGPGGFPGAGAGGAGHDEGPTVEEVD